MTEKEWGDRASRRLEAGVRRLGLNARPTPDAVRFQRDVSKPDWRNRRRYAAVRVRHMLEDLPDLAAREVLESLELESEVGELDVDLTRTEDSDDWSHAGRRREERRPTPRHRPPGPSGWTDPTVSASRCR